MRQRTTLWLEKRKERTSGPQRLQLQLQLQMQVQIQSNGNYECGGLSTALLTMRL